MKWIGKAFSQNFFSALPNGEEFNYFFQKNITRTLPMGETKFLGVLENVFKHIQLINSHNKGTQIDNLRLFEFGAGWHLVGSLTYAAMGLKKQTVIDLTPHLRFELVEVTLNYLKKNRILIEQKYDCRLLDGFLKQVSSMPVDISLLQSIGIDYQAPKDARNTLLVSNSYDLIVNTNTLEHIPPNDIERILKECYRVLKPGGMLSCIIDLGDHFSSFDSSISVYNFLKFSDKGWGLFFNSSFQYQNRLRVSEYLKLFRRAGFEILITEKYRPEKQELDTLHSLKLNKRFAEMDLLEDVAIKRLDVLLRKPPNYLEKDCGGC